LYIYVPLGIKAHSFETIESICSAVFGHAASQRLLSVLDPSTEAPNRTLLFEVARYWQLLSHLELRHQLSNSKNSAVSEWHFCNQTNVLLLYI